MDRVVCVRAACKEEAIVEFHPRGCRVVVVEDMRARGAPSWRTFLLWFRSCVVMVRLGGESMVLTSPWIGFLMHMFAGFSKSLATSLNPPHNISVVLTSWSPPAVRVSWQFDPPRLPPDLNASLAESHLSLHRFELTYRPVNARYRVVEEIPPEWRSIILERLLPGIEYQLFLTSVPATGLATNRSKVIHFISPATARKVNSPIKSVSGPADQVAPGGPQSFTTVREEEVVIVVLVLAVWVAVILLFFNKWGKIRMLEPYQPQYRPHYAPPGPVKPPRLGMSASLSAHMLDQGMGAGRSRFRQNSVFVHPYNRAYSLPEPAVARKFKSAEDIQSLVVHVTSHDDQTTAL